MRKQSRKEYMEDYRKNYGDLMKQQIREWFENHPDYHKRWCQLHPDYHREWQRNHNEHYRKYQKQWREKNRDRINIYMRNYMQQHRNQQPVRN